MTGMKIRHWLTRGAAFLTAAFLAVSAGPDFTSAAADYNLGYSTNPSENDYIYTTRTPRGQDRQVHDHFLPHRKQYATERSRA